MVKLEGSILVGAVVGAMIACTSRDSLFDSNATGGAASGVGGNTTQTGAAPGSGGRARGGSSSTGATSFGGSSVSAGAGDGGAAPGSTGGMADGGDAAPGGAPSGGSAMAATGGTSGGSAGKPGTGGTGGAQQCPAGQMWCPGCTVGSGQCAVGGCPGAACSPCSEVATHEECESRSDCHSVYRDLGVCGCGTEGCCTRFEACVDGDRANCEAVEVQCDAQAPVCDGPSYVLSYSGSCYEGCVKPQDCAPTATTCTLPDGAMECVCYTDTECPTGERCYSADCPNQKPGTCRRPPPDGCFGDSDCPQGETCIGGRPTPCDTSGADRVGTCGVEECPEGDCPGSSGPDCTCLFESECVVATGPLGSGMCRMDDGNCSICKCAAPDTPIATPSGERTISELEVGDYVYSVDGEQIRAVRLVRVNRTPVKDHEVLRVGFDNGRSIEMSAGHPLADGHLLSSLRPGSALLGATVVSVERVPYRHAATYDILPDSTSGAYFASGVLIGSTLVGRSRHGVGPRGHASE